MEHPITAFIREHMNSEELDRQRRIHDLQIQSDLAESRLSKLHKIIPASLQKASTAGV